MGRRGKRRNNAKAAGENPGGFTLIELLVVISLIALLLTLLLPSVRRARNQAKAIVCQARLRQWGLAFKMYTDSNEGRWFTAERESSTEIGPDNWLGLTSPSWFNTRDFIACPRATKGSPDNSYRDAFTAWRSREDAVARTSAGKSIFGPVSYGFNAMVSWPPPQDPRSSMEPRNFYWATCDVREAANVPVFFDSALWGCFPGDCYGPPLGDVSPLLSGIWPMCINRHEGGINMLFMDWSTRKVGLKELWTFKWHRRFNTANCWTRAGGVLPEDWPDWMQGFEEY
jgi:prepilin-type N-terminal cleavage/methylation domain-containing protein/prepilin-type processing-associated H-X9-DG protein